MITIAAYNHSTHLTDEELTAICRALSVQGTHHIAKAWGTAGVSVQARVRTERDWQLHFFANSDQAGALGYHTDLANGLPVMKVFVADCERDSVAPSACASHELAEALIDPYLTTANFDGHSKFWATEVGDPAQAFTYEVAGVTMQDFVTPHWFQSEPPEGATFSYTGAIKRPFDVPPGGYAQFLDLSDPGKGWQQVGMELGAGHTRPGRRRDHAA